ncbi:serine hydrolase domain-containing protein [Paeniglutamicibacter sp. R2-26]|uniref:serine hydrolase domain-containing protein n=1 Tax=Paeniglutamicibacter sp. R2-26 TaxID=3144417 RepID=UPI003EE540B5
MDGTHLVQLPPGMDLKNWQTPEHLRWSFQHIADFLPTAEIPRGPGLAVALPAAHRDLDSLPVPGTDPGLTDTAEPGAEPSAGPGSSVGSVMASTDTDGWMVLHRGRVVTEQYFGTMDAGTQHLLMSVSKSLVGAVAGALTDAGVLCPEQPLTAYVPQLADTGYAGATVRNLLDMRSGIAFSENYLDPFAEVRMLEEAIGWAPPAVPGPVGMYPYLMTLRQKTAHGGAFEYRSCETDMLGWICEAAAGERMPSLMSRVLWGRIGAQADAAIGIDQVGTGMFDGGINATLRDLARFGALFLDGGRALNGERVLSGQWIAETLDGAPDSRQAFANSPGDNRMPGGMYRNQMWFPYEGNNVLLCLGIHGQMIYINRSAKMVGVKLSSWPLPQDAAKLFATLRAFDSIAASLD